MNKSAMSTPSTPDKHSFAPHTPIELMQMCAKKSALRAPSEKVLHLICWDTVQIGCHLVLTGHLRLPYYSPFFTEVGKLLREYPNLYNEVNDKLIKWGMGYKLDSIPGGYRLVLENTGEAIETPSSRGINYFARHADVMAELDWPEAKHPYYTASLLVQCFLLYHCERGKYFIPHFSKLGKLLKNGEILSEITWRLNQSGWVISSCPFGYRIEVGE